jgi:hypothetical protein
MTGMAASKKRKGSTHVSASQSHDIVAVVIGAIVVMCVSEKGLLRPSHWQEEEGSR